MHILNYRVYENVKVTLIRQLALVILIRSSRPSIHCPRMPTRCPRMPSRWVRQSHDVSNSTHDWNRSMIRSYPQSRPTRQSFTVKLCRTGLPIVSWLSRLPRCQYDVATTSWADHAVLYDFSGRRDRDLQIGTVWPGLNGVPLNRRYNNIPIVLSRLSSSIPLLMKWYFHLQYSVSCTCSDGTSPKL